MFDVIEHFVEPDLALKAIKRILKKDGILVLQTPNYESLMQRIVKTWSWWMIEDHKWIFSAKSLKRLLSNEGLTAEYLITYEDWNDIKTNVDGNFVNIKNAVIKKVYKGIFLSFFIPIYLLFRKLIWKAGYGGLIFNIVRKG